MEEYLTPEDVRRLLKISRSKTYAILRGGALKTYRVGRLVRIRAEDLRRFVEGRAPQPRKFS